MTNTIRKRLGPMSVVATIAVLGLLAAFIALAALPETASAQPAPPPPPGTAPPPSGHPASAAASAAEWPAAAASASGAADGCRRHARLLHH